MPAPLLQAQVDIDAPVDKVWRLITDLGRMPEWSPQCRMMRPLGPVPNFEQELVDGMNASLSRIKAAAEKP